MKSIDPKELSRTQLQNYMQHVIAPRPIALVSTIDAKGRVNLSPFSFFNMFGVNPPICIFSPSRRVRDNSPKHTLENLYEVPECVIHIVSPAMVHQTSLSSTEYAKGVDEFQKAGFTPLPSQDVKPPRVAESPVHLECRVNQLIALGEGPGAGNLVVAEIIRMHLDEALFDEDGNIAQPNLEVVARLGGDWYASVTQQNLFKVKKPLLEKGIGFDRLPQAVLQSDILTGNDLAQLANVPELPSQAKVEAYLTQEVSFQGELQMLNLYPENRSFYAHRRAKMLITENKAEEAWLCLLAETLHAKKSILT